MASPSTPSRSRYSDLPKLDNADGAIDWARKVRALQQQVDADEEAEYKRLQEEIAASRIARKRRSRGGFVSPTSAEFAGSRESLSGVSRNSSTSDLKSVAERQQNQAEALQKLAGSSTPPSNTDTTSSIATARAWMASTASNATASKPSGPMSLAAFMGGRATGPILNRHAPQQDAHDPTQFEDRTRITSPHPVFGRGGVAMPGLAVSNRFPRRDENASTPTVASPKLGRGRAFVTLDKTSSPVQTGALGASLSTTAPLVIRPRSASSNKANDERPVSPQKTGGRDRTISTPSASSYLSKSSTVDHSASSQKNGFRERTISSPSPAFPLIDFKSPVEAGREISVPPQETASLRRPVSTNFTPPKTSAQSPSLSTPPPYKSPVVTPSLAKAIRPDPKPSPQAPHISISPNTSLAFLKPPLQKEPTPSLSRLQGRGFVQNIVKASHAQTPPSSTQTTPDRPVSATRKTTVLERWQHHGASSPTPSSPPPVTSPKPLAMRKSFTVEPTSSLKTTEPRALSKPGKTLPMMTKTESDPVRSGRVTHPMLDPQGTGLGSATTLVVFKPPADEEVESFGDVNELGVKHTVAIVPSHQKLPVATGKPLTHPTKERARKPKKSREPSAVKLVSEMHPLFSTTQRMVESTQSTAVPIESESPITLEPPRPVPVSKAPSGSGNGGRIADRWAEQALIGVKPVLSRLPSAESEAPKFGGMIGRRALPGLATTPTLAPVNIPPSPYQALPVKRTESSEKSPASPNAAKYPFESNRPTTPGRHSRIPSTGNRATVMDVAQAFAEPEKQALGSPEQGNSSLKPVQEPDSLPPLSHDLLQNTSPPTSAERRRSSYHEKYVAIALPPLQEEVTPAPTPAGTLARGSSPMVETIASTRKDEVLQNKSVHAIERTESVDSVVRINHNDPPLPDIDIESLLKTHQRSKSNADLATVSVEVMVISGNNATVLSRETNVFHDAEVLAIVHRSKSKSSGLVSTVVWGWFGKNCAASDLEQRKLEELSKRYGTTVIVVEQYAEPLDMLRVLGNCLVVRQGKREHWSADNTAMHVVRSRRGIVFIDELELNVRNLCSGFSYCLTVLETIYVWYGCGSVASERKAALTYGHSLGENVVELQEGQDNGDEMFWMILGDDAFANANYWRWRPSAADITPRIWKVSEHTVQPVEFLKAIPTMVHLIDCVWEFFVVVGSEARAQRQNIRISLHVASELVKRVAWRRPYTPPIHVVVLPSQLPLDLKIHLRELDESSINPQGVPEHMNLLTVHEAYDHIRRTSWERFSLRDPLMLPLGIHPELIAYHGTSQFVPS